MPPKRRKFQRQLGQRRYRKLFVIAVEGVKTEPQYFAIFNDQQSVIRVNCLKGSHGSAPPKVLKRMEEHLRKEGLKSSDEAWLVVDKDQWTDEQLALLHRWAQERNNYGFALSNPKFEYWLLLHFEDGTGITSSRDCSERLERNLPGYDKGIDSSKMTRDRIDDAIRRAKLRDNPPCSNWPRILGSTTVYKLIERILDFS
ncbi:MAG: RloB domain-containing protein [Deltaproteobacteria bacterium]|nr:RloB domain-containing protein [Deltaproteobacteria bacterium]